MTAPPPPDAAPIRVWDRPVRLLHWTLAAAVAVAWCTGEETLRWHEAAGFTAAGAVALRTAWGFGARGAARFASFVRSPAVTWAYARTVLGGTEARYRGHNPLGGWMVVALLATVAAACITGWLYTTDAFWGLAWLDLLHRGLAWAVLLLVPVHVAGVVLTGRRHRENLVAAMVTGRKRRGGEETADAGDDPGSA